MEDLIFEKGEIATVTVNRPKALNALNRTVVEGLAHVLRDVRHDPSIRVLIVTGAGDRAFVAGADIAAMSAMSTVDGMEFCRLLMNPRNHALRFFLTRFGSTTANSSPPYRAAVSIARQCTRRMSATRQSARLPTKPPKLSLIFFGPSPGPAAAPRKTCQVLSVRSVSVSRTSSSFR